MKIAIGNLVGFGLTGVGAAGAYWCHQAGDTSSAAVLIFFTVMAALIQINTLE